MSLLLGLLLLVAAVAAPGCCSAAPQVVQDALTHTLEDLARCEAEVLPLVPEDATIPVVTLAGTTETGKAREVWRLRLRGLQLRTQALLAWAKDKAFDFGKAMAETLPTELKGGP